MSALRAALDDYLQIRRRLGFEMPQDGRLLEGFVEFLERAGVERITTDLALAWARMPAQAHPSRWGQRLGVARGFARHLAAIDPVSEVPPTDLLPGHRPRIAPIHLFRSGDRVVAGGRAAAETAAACGASRDADRSACGDGHAPG